MSVTRQILIVDKLRIAIGEPTNTWILRDVSFSVEVGKIIGLVGESGAGKTMVSRAILGFLPTGARCVSGRALFDGRDLAELSMNERRQLLSKDMAYIPQNPMTALNPVIRIKDQVCDVLKLHLGLNSREAHLRSIELLDEVRLPDPEKIMSMYPHELSGGMRQRVLIAIAFACRPKLVIADEPTTALDVTVQKQILQLLKSLQQKYQTATLFITHDLGVVAKICDAVHVMHGGRIIESADTETLINRPKHPYTASLVAATPRFDLPANTLHPIPDGVVQRLNQEMGEWDSRA
ncbi:MAG: ABC transporter ATP-binding protein [Betaproteobacteria bacterium]